MGETSCVDARVALLEGVYLQLAIHMGRDPIPQEPVVSGRRETAGVDWGQLDQFQVDTSSHVEGTGSVGRCELIHRADRFAAGRWAELIATSSRPHASLRTFRGS